MAISFFKTLIGSGAWRIGSNRFVNTNQNYTGFFLTLRLHNIRYKFLFSECSLKHTLGNMILDTCIYFLGKVEKFGGTAGIGKFSLKGQIVNIWGFASQMVSVMTLIFAVVARKSSHGQHWV